MQDNQPINVSSIWHRNRAIAKARQMARVLLTALLRRAANNRETRLEAASRGAF